MSDEIARIAGKLTKAQRRVLVRTGAQSPTSRRGYMVKGTQGRPVRALRRAGLIEVEEVSTVFCRISLWLRPTPLGLEVRRHLLETNGHD